ncbi:hypothetical protein ACHAWF_015211 [Thalassiosira exigua]
MFSIKYTSPKLTPKKGAPVPSAESGPPPPSPYGRAGAAHRSNSPRISPGYATRARSPGAYAVGRASPSDADATQRPAATSASAIPVMPVDSRDSDNDSTVADISEEVEHRPNILSLLDRDYATESSSGEGGEKMASDASSAICSDVPSSAIFSGLPDEGNCSTLDGETLEEGVDLDQRDAIEDGAKSCDVGAPSNAIDLTQGYSLHETAGGSFEYRRSISMEPLFEDQSGDSAPLTHATMVDEGSVEVTPVGESGSLLSSSMSEDGDRTLPLELGKVKGDDGPLLPIDDVAGQPSSPRENHRFADRNGNQSMPPESPPSDIGGDTYFDHPFPQPEAMNPKGKSADDDLVHVTLPPRVNRTTLNANGNPPFMPKSSPLLKEPISMQKQRSLTPSPRPPFTHMHSLLDECSDEDEDATSFTIVDSPIRHFHSYSCLPRARATSEGSSPFSSYFKKQRQGKLGRAQSAGSTANKVANNNIQQALLQTRHRRWNCQMAYAGPHAQSNQVFDISNRAHYIAGHIPKNCKHLAARLSVSSEALRAAALASGLWRTVRLVRLPKGLFWSQTATVKWRREGNDVWPLLTMLDTTFPALEQVDFGGDLSNKPDEIIADSEHWRDEILMRVVECLPNIRVVDGLAVAGTGSRVEKVPPSLNEAMGQKSAASNASTNPRAKQALESSAGASCVECEVPMCGANLSDLVDGQDQASCILDTTSYDASGDLNVIESNDAEESGGESGQHGSSANAHVHAKGNASEKDMAAGVQKECEALVIQGTLSHESMEDLKKVATLSSSSSLLSSSRSWGSTGSGTRPPTCPNSISRQRPRLPTKPADRKKATGLMKAGGGLKRRVLGLIPTVSMMDDEEEDDSDESIDNVGESPTDIL